MTKTPRLLLGLTAPVAMLGASAPPLLHGQGRPRPGDDAADQQNPARQAAGVPRSRQRPAGENPPPPGDNGPASVQTSLPDEFRAINGVGNNPRSPEWGASDQHFLRLLPAAYEDGVGSPSGSDRPSARALSNAVCAQVNFTTNQHGATDYLWPWGQFLDHVIDETPSLDPPEALDADEDGKISKKEIRNTSKAPSSLYHDQDGELTHLELPPSDPAMDGHLAAK